MFSTFYSENVACLLQNSSDYNNSLTLTINKIKTLIYVPVTTQKQNGHVIWLTADTFLLYSLINFRLVMEGVAPLWWLTNTHNTIDEHHNHMRFYYCVHCRNAFKTLFKIINDSDQIPKLAEPLQAMDGTKGESEMNLLAVAVVTQQNSQKEVMITLLSMRWWVGCVLPNCQSGLLAKKCRAHQNYNIDNDGCGYYVHLIWFNASTSWFNSTSLRCVVAV